MAGTGRLKTDERLCRVAVLTGDHSLRDPTKRDGSYHEEDALTHQAMMAAFNSLDGYNFEFWSDHSELLERLRLSPPDLVVNFCDTGFRNVPTLELNIPAYMELLDIPYSGAPPAAIVICFDKSIVRAVAGAEGIPVPGESFIPAEMPLEELNFRKLATTFPALIKPNRADGSVGITKDAVVHDEGEASAYLKWLRAALPGRDVLVQEYLPGSEYGIGLIGNSDQGFLTLPPLEVDYTSLPAGLSPILSFESKAIPSSPYWTDIKFKRAAISEDMERRMGTWSRKLFKRLGLRDYGRFDFRVGGDGEVKLMEVNPNPAWANDGKLAFMAGFAGIAYPEMLRLILEAARKRSPSI